MLWPLPSFKNPGGREGSLTTTAGPPRQWEAEFRRVSHKQLNAQNLIVTPISFAHTAPGPTLPRGPEPCARGSERTDANSREPGNGRRAPQRCLCQYIVSEVDRSPNTL